MIPVSVESNAGIAAKSQARRPRRSKIRAAGRRKSRAAARNAAGNRQPRSSVAGQTQQQGLLNRALEGAVEAERNTVDVVGALALAAIDVMETAASMVVGTPAALLGAQPRIVRRSNREVEVFPYSVVPAIPALLPLAA